MSAAEETLPPRQIATRVFPRIGEREPEPFDPRTWALAVDGPGWVMGWVPCFVLRVT